MKNKMKGIRNIVLVYKSFIIIALKLGIIIICTVILNTIIYCLFNKYSIKAVTKVSALLALIIFILIYIKSKKINVKKTFINIVPYIKSIKTIKLLLFALFMQFIKVLIVFLIDMYIPIVDNMEDSEIYSNVYRMIDYFNMIVLGPIVEEIIFRKTLYTSLKKIYTNIKSNLIQSCIFSMFHLSLIGFAFHFITGCFLGAIYQKEKTIIAPILFHSFLNAFGIVLLYIFKMG